MEPSSIKFSAFRMCHLSPRSVLSTGPRTCEISLAKKKIDMLVLEMDGKRQGEQ